MVHVTEVSQEDLVKQREAILKDLGMTRDEFAEKAHSYQLVGEEWGAWDELRNVEFLLGEDKT